MGKIPAGLAAWEAGHKKSAAPAAAKPQMAAAANAETSPPAVTVKSHKRTTRKSTVKAHKRALPAALVAHQFKPGRGKKTNPKPKPY